MFKWLWIVIAIILLLQIESFASSYNFDKYCKMKKLPANITLNSNCVYSLSCSLKPAAGNNFSINGNGAVIKCTQNGGVLVENVPQVSINNVTFEDCGGITTTFRTSAISIGRSECVSLDNVIVKTSSGTGLSLVHCTGIVNISYSVFSCNTDGGGVYIEPSQDCHIIISYSHFTDNSAPEVQDNRNDSGGGLYLNLSSTTNVTASIAHSHFINNTAHRGGGLFLKLYGECTNNEVTVSNCYFIGNRCTSREPTHTSSGGGIGFLDKSNPKGSGLNKVLIERSYFENNMAYYGGGIEANMGALYVTTDSSNARNTFTVRECNMTLNSARVGSAINLFCYTTKKPSSLCMFKLKFENLNITKNEGTYKCADDKKVNTCSQQCADDKKVNTYSTVHLEMVTVTISGRGNTITHNKASGVSLNNAEMVIESNASVCIENNQAVVGGGIAAVGTSIIFLQPTSNVRVVGNSASDRGGGIYAIQTLDTYIPYSKACFIKYLTNDDNNAHTSPKEWDVNVTIMKNKADGKLNAIFASSIYPCVWRITDSFCNDLTSTFCKWKNWTMDDNCTDSIITLPSSFNESEYSVTIYPNNVTEIPNFKVLDDLNHDVINETIFSVCTLDLQEKKCDSNREQAADLNRRALKMKGKPDQYQLLVQTVGFRSISTKLDVQLLECPAGYTDQDGCTCVVTGSSVVNCKANSTQLILSVLLGHCLGYNNKSGVVVAKCPYNICPETIKNPFIQRSLQRETINEEFCKPYNRIGFLCQKCIRNHGIDVFSPDYQCIKCDHLFLDWIKGIVATLVPQIFFLTIIIVFHIGITSPSMNGYIFFSHVSLLPVQVILINIAWKLDLNHKHWSSFLTHFALSPYRLWTFDYPEMFGIKACFHQNFKIIHALAFQYLQAFFPSVLILITLLLIELHARNCKPVVYLWRPLCYLCIRLRRTWELRTSVIDALATVVLLSYSKIINTSISLLRRNPVIALESTTSKEEALLDLDTSTQYLKGSHVYFAITAIIILLTFGLLPPVLLTLYPYKHFKKLIGLVKLDQWHGLYAFVETFQGCYKDGTNGTPDRRWFAGMYFIFRIIIFLEFAFISDLSNLFAKLTFTYIMFLLFFITIRPYKRDYYNYLDCIFLINLASVNLFIYYLIIYAQQNNELSNLIWYFTYMLLLLPTLYLLFYLIYLSCTRSKYLKTHCLSKLRRVRQRSYRFLAESPFRGAFFHDDNFSVLGGDLISAQAPLDNLSEVPDRMDHPYRYSRDLDESHRLGSSASFHKTGRTNCESRGRLL